MLRNTILILTTSLLSGCAIMVVNNSLTNGPLKNTVIKTVTVDAYWDKDEENLFLIDQAGAYAMRFEYFHNQTPDWSEQLENPQNRISALQDVTFRHDSDKHHTLKTGSTIEITTVLWLNRPTAAQQKLLEKGLPLLHFKGEFVPITDFDKQSLIQLKSNRNFPLQLYLEYADSLGDVRHTLGHILFIPAVAVDIVSLPLWGVYYVFTGRCPLGIGIH